MGGAGDRFGYSDMWVTDGSYNRELAPSVSGAGWVLYCTHCGKKLFGSFAEFSPKAGSYCAELLGLLAIHISWPPWRNSTISPARPAPSVVTIRAPSINQSPTAAAFRWEPPKLTSNGLPQG